MTKGTWINGIPPWRQPITEDDVAEFYVSFACEAGIQPVLHRANELLGKGMPRTAAIHKSVKEAVANATKDVCEATKQDGKPEDWSEK